MKNSKRIAFVLATALLLWGCQSHSIREAREPLWGDRINPTWDCDMSWDGHELLFQLPPGNYNLNSKGENGLTAPRVMMPVKGDFVATVKISGEFDPGNEAVDPALPAFIGAGILLWENKDNYIRLERNIWSRGTDRRMRYAPLLEHFLNGIPVVKSPVAREPFFKEETWLKLERRGSQIITAVSHDGEIWTAEQLISAEFPDEVHIGVSVVSTCNKTVLVNFSDFNVTQL